MSEEKKKIISLTDFEHVRKRPTIYVGSVDPSEEKIPIVRDGVIHIENRTVSVGFYKLFSEILDNSVDEAKRMKGKMKSISVDIDTVTNMVSVTDSGNGFFKGIEKNDKTGLPNIETAMSQLRAGSNFFNEDLEEHLIGTNGVGAALVNMLSSSFVVESRNKESYFYQEWRDFISIKQEIKKAKQTELGTTVRFIPSPKVFKGCNWDTETIKTILLFKKYLMSVDKDLKSLVLFVTIDGIKLDLAEKFLPTNKWSATTSIGTIDIYENYENSGSLSFVNSAMCTGMHQRVINEIINAKLADSLGHHFYEVFFVLNLPPKLVKFADQNKTKYVGTREEIEPVLRDAFERKLHQFFDTDLFKRILKAVDDRRRQGDLNRLRNAKRKTNAKYSTKYTAPSGRTENLFIVEGESAAGAVLQKRNAKTDGVYSLKGKIKNVRSVSDLTDNKEILELMQILDLDPDPTKRSFTFKRIIVATDADEDGAHIFSLILNLFWRWFPYIIDEGRLFLLLIPLISVDDGGKKKMYFYNKQEFEVFARKKKPKGMQFLKGLGSLDLPDWDFVMNNKRLLQVRKGDEAGKFMDMAFGLNSDVRKKWLAGRPF